MTVPAGRGVVSLRPAVIAAFGYGVLAAIYVVSGASLPGGRWFGVHLFTLGVLSNLIVALAPYFSRTVLRVREGPTNLPRSILLNAGVVVMLAFPPAERLPFVAGAAAVAAAVGWVYVDLSRMRARSLGGPFAFLVRSYAVACVALIVGATLGVLLRLGMLPGAWSWGGRLAHLHVNVLGWGGLTLLATVLFFGPTVMRVDIEPASAQAAPGRLRMAQMGIVVAVPSLLPSAFPTWPATLSRFVAAGGIALYAWAASGICAGVVVLVRRARPRVESWMMVSACSWFVVAVWVDVLVVARPWARLYDALGVVLLAGVLLQAILSSLTHLAPVVWGAARDARASSSGILHRTRVFAYNLGVLLAAGAAVAGRGAETLGAVTVRAGWALVAGVAVMQLLVSLRLAVPAFLNRS